MSQSHGVIPRQAVWELRKADRFETKLLKGRKVLVDRVCLYDWAGVPFVYAEGTIIRKSSGTVGKYRDEGVARLDALPHPLLVKIIEQWRRAGS